jgi:hypothetical protein
MSSENLYVTVRAPLATLPLAKWTVICTYEQFWDSRLSRLASEHVSNPLAKAFGLPNYETGQVRLPDDPGVGPPLPCPTNFLQAVQLRTTGSLGVGLHPG